MSLFDQLENKLLSLASRLSAKLTRDRPEYPDILRTFEERRLDWVDGGVNKAIIIQPCFEDKAVNTRIWNFIIIAWFDNAKSEHIPRWLKILVNRKEFSIIEKNIDELLTLSEEHLKKIKMEDLT